MFKTREEYRKYHREWKRKKREDEDFREKERVNNRKYREKNKDKIKEIQRLADKKRKKKHLNKIQARKAVNQAIKSKKMERGKCVKCGVKNAEGHHEDYSKPLKVIWFCGMHHRLIHRKNWGIQELEIKTK